jgi:type II secretion system protein H
MFSTPPTSWRGYTLVELVMVMVIIALVAAVAAPRYAAALSRYRVDAAARRIADDFAFAQAKARATGTTRTLFFDRTNERYRLINESDLNKASTTYTVDLADEPYRVSIATVSFGGAGTVSFNGFGVPSGSGTIELRSGKQTRVVSLNGLTGIATLQ